MTPQCLIHFSVNIQTFGTYFLLYKVNITALKTVKVEKILYFCRQIE